MRGAPRPLVLRSHTLTSLEELRAPSIDMAASLNGLARPQPAHTVAIITSESMPLAISPDVCGCTHLYFRQLSY